jgi:hypothetical protein
MSPSDFITKYDPKYSTVRLRFNEVSHILTKSEIEKGDYIFFRWLHGEPWHKVKETVPELKLHGIPYHVYDTLAWKNQNSFKVVKEYEARRYLTE